jgi:TRAP-type C4-dicarboxylate transport system substrate-binding protein
MLRGIFVVSLLMHAAASAASPSLRIAVLAQEESTGVRFLREWAGAVSARTPFAIEIHAGGVDGAEAAVVPKLRAGDVDGATLTTVGLGRVAPELRALELPMLFEDDDELDQTRAILDAELRAKLRQGGCELIAWADTGAVQLFSVMPVAEQADFARVRHWAWDGDPLLDTLLRRMGSPGVAAGIEALGTALLSGRINGVYGAPLVILAMQLNVVLTRFMTVRLATATGALVVARQAWERLPPATQQIVLEEAKRLQTRLLAQARQDGPKATQLLVAAGATAVATPPSLKQELLRQARVVAAQFDGKIYSRSWRERVQSVIAEVRKGKRLVQPAPLRR